MRIKRIALVGAVVAVAIPVAVAYAATTTLSIKPQFDTNKLGKGTTVTYKVNLDNDDGSIPLPSKHALAHLPKGLGIDFKPFTDVTCSKAQIDSRGVDTCPRKAIIGKGMSHIRVKLGNQLVYEGAPVTAFAGPPQGGKPVINFYADARSPVSAQIVIEGVQVKDPDNKYGPMLDVTIPRVPTSPGSPDASIVDFTVTVGAHKNVRKGKKVTAHDLVTVPKTCPKGGFNWGLDITLQDNSVVKSTGTSPCPKKG